ncbi:MAG: hypothetical protein NTY35_08165 [Planctomycetota bacterium]|nr:hypothetical protein [Planctomycetota bacterium]
MTTIANGIVHQREDPELRRHRTEVLAKSRVWRIVTTLAALATVVWAVRILTQLFFG